MHILSSLVMNKFSMRIQIGLFFFLMLSFFSCREDEGLVDLIDENLLGNYHGIETFSQHPAFPPETPDTTYSQNVVITAEAGHYVVTREITPVEGYSGLQLDMTYSILASDLISNEYFWGEGPASNSRQRHVQFSGDSLYLYYNDDYWTNNSDWHFYGKKE
jgi:hypothetical protein